MGRGRVPALRFFASALPLLAVAHPIRPKPPSATSIPAILKALQDEWVSPWKGTDGSLLEEGGPRH